MSESQTALSDHVMIQCPACGAAEAAHSGTLSGEPTIVCRNCGETWPAAAQPDGPHGTPAAAVTDAPVRVTVDAERRSLVTYSAGAGKAWQAKIDGDIVPQIRPPPRLVPMAGAMIAILFIAVFLGGRQAAVASLPDLAGLYAALGLPVNLTGLAIEDLVAERTPAGAAASLAVRGTIRNVAAVERRIPALAIAFGEGPEGAAGQRRYEPPQPRIGSGETIPFLIKVRDSPGQGGRIVVRFARPAESLPAGDGGGAGGL